MDRRTHAPGTGRLSAVAFGVWDIFYYLWLAVFIGWPTSLFDRDLLFLIPLPWWGPVLSPVLIAVVMIVGGARAVRLAERGVRVRGHGRGRRPARRGALLMLVAFMWDSLRALPASPQQLARVAPTPFLWPLYLVGLVPRPPRCGG